MTRKPALYLQDPDLEQEDEDLEEIRQEQLELDPERDLTWGRSGDDSDCDWGGFDDF